MPNPPTTCPECGRDKGRYTWRGWAIHLRTCLAIKPHEMPAIMAKGTLSLEEARHRAMLYETGKRIQIQDRGEGMRSSRQRIEDAQQGFVGTSEAGGRPNQEPISIQV